MCKLIFNLTSFEELQDLLQDKGKLFLNSMYTDSYTCRIPFCRKRYPASPLDKVSLELDSFNIEDIGHYFPPWTADPNRKGLFVSYHGSNDFRRLSSAKYYDMKHSKSRLFRFSVLMTSKSFYQQTLWTVFNIKILLEEIVCRLCSKQRICLFSSKESYPKLNLKGSGTVWQTNCTHS